MNGSSIILHSSNEIISHFICIGMYFIYQYNDFVSMNCDYIAFIYLRKGKKPSVFLITTGYFCFEYTFENLFIKY